MSHDWTPAEKNLARSLFDRAVSKATAEYLALHQQQKFTTIEELWAYELKIRYWRKEFSSIFQFTYSRLELSFAVSLQRGWLQQSQLNGLRDDRIQRIVAMAKGEINIMA